MLLLLKLFLLPPPANAGMCFFSHLLAPLPLEKPEELFPLHIGPSHPLPGAQVTL